MSAATDCTSGVHLQSQHTIRRFASADATACRAIFCSNVPRHFAPDEQPEFEAFLANPVGDYWVLETAGALVACGGGRVDGNVGRLIWGMVHAAHHGAGVGRALLRWCLDHLCRRSDLVTVAIETSQWAEGFFARHGFEVTRRVPDGFGPGLDSVDMHLQAERWHRWERGAWL